MSLNIVIIAGNLGRDPEMRYTPQGRAVTTASVAVNRRWQQDGEWQEATDWFNVVVWGDAAERFAENMRKGEKVLVQGRLQTRSYEDKEGKKQYRTEVIANRVESLGKPGQRQAPEDAGARDAEYGEGPARTAELPLDDHSMDDLPF